MPTENRDFDQFVAFALHQLKSTPDASPEVLLRKWRSEQESAEVIADVKEGLADYAAGRMQTAEDAFRDIRRELGFTP